MTKVSDVYQSRFLKPSDLLDEETGEYREPKVQIATYAMEELPSRDGKRAIQPVLEFVGKKKVLPLNVTNARTIQEQLGDEMDEWKGKTIQLYITTIPQDGVNKTVIRIKPRGMVTKTAAAAPTAPAPVAAPPPPAPAPKGFDPDEIPF